MLCGNIVSKTLISKDRYIATDEIIKVGVKEEEVIIIPITPEPTPEVVTPTPTIDKDDDLPPGWDSPESPYGNR